MPDNRTPKVATYVILHGGNCLSPQWCTSMMEGMVKLKVRSQEQTASYSASCVLKAESSKAAIQHDKAFVQLTHSPESAPFSKGIVNHSDAQRH